MFVPVDLNTKKTGGTPTPTPTPTPSPSPTDPVMTVDFAAPPSAFNYAAASPTLTRADDGTWRRTAVGSSRVVDSRLALDPPTTNLLRNAAMAGAVAGQLGSGGALPTNMTSGGATGAVISVVGTGTENGRPYVDLSWSGTSSSTWFLNFDATNIIPLSKGQVLLFAPTMKLLSGTWPNGASVHVGERNSSGGDLAKVSTRTIPAIPATDTAFPVYRKATDDAVAFASIYVRAPAGTYTFSVRIYDATVAIDRVLMTTPIPQQGARGETATVNIANGTYDVLVIDDFDSRWYSAQAVTNGKFALPVYDLIARPQRIRKVVFYTAGLTLDQKNAILYTALPLVFSDARALIDSHTDKTIGLGLNTWERDTIEQPYAIQKADGLAIIRYECRMNDGNSGGKTTDRSELRMPWSSSYLLNNIFEFDRNYYRAFDIMLGGTPTTSTDGQKNWQLLDQLHQLASDSGDASLSPPYCLSMSGAQLRLVTAHDANPQQTTGTNINQTTRWSRDNVELNVWHRVVMKFRFNYNGTAELVYYFNNEKVFDSKDLTGGFSMGFNDALGAGRGQTGLYRAQGYDQTTTKLHANESGISTDANLLTDRLNNPPPLPIQQVTVSPMARTLAVAPGAGGFVLGGNIADDASRLAVNTDVATVFHTATNDDNWQFAITPSKVPDYATITADGSNSSSGNGTYAVDLFGPDPRIAYFAQRGRLWKTTNSFGTVSLIPNFFQPMFQNDGNTRGWNDKLKIDPIDSNSFIIGTNGAGAYVSIDGGVTLTKIGVPDVTLTEGGIKMPVLVAVDKSSAALNGRKRRWALYVAGQGIYVSTTGPNGAFTAVAGVPADAMNGAYNIQFDKDGNLYVAPFNVSKLYKMTTAGVWSLETDFECAAWCILDNGQRVAMGPSGSMRWTDVNSPTVWPNDTVQPHYPLANNIELVSTKNLWLNKQTWQCFPYKMLADPVTPNKFWVFQGIGVCWCIAAQRLSDKPAEGRMTFNDFSGGSPGIRELIPLKTMFRHTDGMLIETGWDKGPFFSKSISDQRNPIQTRDLGVEHGWDVGYLPQDPAAIWAYIKWSNNRSGFTFDDGVTWTQFADHPDPDVQGGCMQFVSRTRGFWLPSNNQRAVQTSDGGQSWQPLVFTSPEGQSTVTQYTAGDDTGWSFAYYFNKQNLLASYEEPGVVYAYNYGPDAKQTLRGVWRKEANSQTFVRVFSGSPSGGNAHLYYQMAIREVPGRVGDLIITAGFDSMDTEVIRTLDRGVTWNAITTGYQGRTVKLNAVTAIGFGKAKQGATHPAMRFAGRIKDASNVGIYGVYETLDNFATIQLIENYPLDSIQAIVNIAGDPLNFGRWIYGLDSNGWVESVIS